MLIDLDDRFIPDALEGNQPICFIQGDTYSYTIVFDQDSIAENMSRLVFSCNKLNLEMDFNHVVENDGSHIFTIEFLDTSDFPICETTYDVVAFVEDNFDTYIFSQTGIPFIVKKRKNPLTGGSAND